jgi:hypothetical protein
MNLNTTEIHTFPLINKLPPNRNSSCDYNIIKSIPAEKQDVVPQDSYTKQSSAQK